MEAGPATFEDVYLRHADSVYRFCYSLLRDPADAEDTTAATFVSAYAAWARVHPPAGEVRAWLFRIARNASIDQLRRRARRQRLLTLLHPGVRPRREVEAEVVVRDELRQVVEAMAALRRHDRELVGLRIAGELSFAEVAAIVGMSEPAVRTATRRALARLQANLRETS